MLENSQLPSVNFLQYFAFNSSTHLHSHTYALEYVCVCVRWLFTDVVVMPIVITMAIVIAWAIVIFRMHL